MPDPREEHVEDLEIVEAPELEEVDRGFELMKIPDEAALNKAFSLMDNAVKFVEKVQAAVLKQTRPGDWVLRDGKPYFTEAGCNRFRAPFGIYSRDIKSWTLDSDGTRKEITDRNVFEGDVKFIFVAGVIGSKLLGVEAYFEGGAKLDDGFKEKNDVLFYAKKARANWYGTGIRKLTGMENFRVEDLEKAGIKVSEITAIHGVSTAKAEVGDAKKLWELLLDMNAGDMKQAEDYLFKLTDKPPKYPGKKRASQLSAGQMKWVYPAVHSEWKKKFPDKAAEEEKAKSGGDAATPKAHDQTNEGFLKSAEALKAQIPEQSFIDVLAEFKVMNVGEVPADKRNQFLLALGKKAKK